MKLIGVLWHLLGWTLFASFLSSPPHAHGALQQVTPVDFSEHGGNWVEGNCASRDRQSPIDLNELFKPPQGTFNFKYDDLPFGKNITVTNDGRVISAALQDGSLSTLGGLALDLNGDQQWFNLVSIEVRSQSEHTLRGKHFPLEIQLVHRPSHFSGGPQVATVSIFVDCPNPPKAKDVFPGLLQTQVSSNKRLRGNRSFAFLQRTPSVDDNVDEDPAHLRLNAEVNFVHSLVEGEDALAANDASTTPSPADANETNVTYVTPPSGAADFNALLQFLVAEEPPDLDTTTVVATKPGVPLSLAAMVASGTYFKYWGSQTLPPCAPNEVWLVKREPMRASTQQVRALFETVHLMSSGAGNFRTTMPLNGRIAEVLKSEEGIPRTLMPVDSVSQRSAGQEEQYVEASKDAITLAKAAADYAKDMDWRVQKAALAHLNALAETTTTTFAPTTSVLIPKPPGDAIWVANIFKDIIKSSLKKAVDENVKEMVPATASLTISYLRQRILKNANFNPPPPGAHMLIPTPIPGIPTFAPPETVAPVTMNITQIMAALIAANCTDCNANATCGNIPGISAIEASRYIARFASMNVQGFTCNAGSGFEDDDEEQLTPDDISLPDGVDPVPSDWPDPDCGQWGSGLPPSGIPPWTSDWPDPNAYKPAGWSDYEWQRYQWNWQVYNSQYAPYRSSYSGYSINRRRRGFAARGYNYQGRDYNSNYGGYGGQRRRGYDSSHWSGSRSRYSSSRSRYSSSRSRYSSSRSRRSSYGSYSSRSRRSYGSSRSRRSRRFR